MRIPDNLQSFPAPALILVTDGTAAKIFLAYERELELLDTVGGSALQTQEAREAFFAELSATLTDWMKKKEVEHAAITVPDYYLEELKESLHINLLKRVFAFVPKRLLDEDPVEIVALVQELSEE